jgi:S-adenosyl-L-methionine hydrolase (adenosine-forming)
VGVKPSGVVTLLTDFGLEDPYVCMMKGVILSINPAARIIDISHHVTPGAVGQAAQMLQETYPYFPEGTVHVAVVDPGVGTDRRAIVLLARSHLFVGPDNGTFSPIMEACPEAEVIHLSKTRYFLEHISNTFHGRDIFAPVAAHLSQGIDPLNMGPVIHDPIHLKFPAPYRKGGSLYGLVVRIDRFGNLLTNIRAADIAEFSAGSVLIVRIGDLHIEGIQRTYAQTAPGEALALLGSSGYLEIAVNRGRAADRTGVDPTEIIGREVEVSRVQGDSHQS